MRIFGHVCGTIDRSNKNHWILREFRLKYLRRIDTMKASRIKAEERFPISEQGYMIGKLLDGTEYQMLLDIGASKSFMLKSHYLHCKSLHLLSKFA